ncbi:MAG: hypothetical protein V2J08_11930 [Desulfotignum sp.]|nr:hypothetical protein [Desulfotignum sp.]
MAEASSIAGEWVKKTIKDFIATSLLNTMEDNTGSHRMTAQRNSGQYTSPYRPFSKINRL